MAYTDPFSPDAEQRIRFSSRHVITATAYPRTGDPVELDVESATLTFDESSSPYARGQLTCLIPGDQSVIDRLDSRKTFRVEIRAGYVWDSVTEDVHTIAKLHVRARQVTRPDNRLVLTLEGDESLASDYKRMSWDPQPPQSNLKDVVQFHADKARKGDTPATVVSQFPAGYGSTAVAGVTQDPGQDSWALLRDAMAKGAARIYADELGVWHIDQPAALSSVTSLNLTTGGGGVISTATAALDRDEFYNAVTIGYKWRDGAGVEQAVYGNAYISSGDLATSAIGVNSFYEERTIPATQAQADAAALTALKALSRRGTQYDLTAISAYWLRPGQTVTATLPDSAQDRVLVSAVSFQFPSGQMAVRLRRPEDLTFSTTA